MEDDGIPDTLTNMHAELIIIGSYIDELKEYRYNHWLSEIDAHDVQAQMLVMYQYHAILESRIVRAHK